MAGPGILLAALAIAGSFLAFLPTAYRGVSELGAIAGFGMLVAASLSLSLLPALLRLTAPRTEVAEIGWRGLIPLEARAGPAGAGDHRRAWPGWRWRRPRCCRC